MELHELDRLTPVTRRTAEHQRPAERTPVPTLPSAVMNLQRMAGNESVNALLGDEREESSPVRDVVGSGGGSPLDTGARSFLEERMGTSFSDVRVHTGPKADE